jgi:hypothetical protein
LFIPATVQLIHVIEGHEHQVCVSLEEQHFHENEFDCSLFHRQYQTLSLDFPLNDFTITNDKYYTLFYDIFQFEHVIFHSKKNPRGPPIIV